MRRICRLAAISARRGGRRACRNRSDGGGGALGRRCATLAAAGPAAQTLIWENGPDAWRPADPGSGPARPPADPRRPDLTPSRQPATELSERPRPAQQRRSAPRSAGPPEMRRTAAAGIWSGAGAGLGEAARWRGVAGTSPEKI